MINFVPRLFCLSLCAFLFFKSSFANDSTQTSHIILPGGFKSVIIAENIGRARHLVVTPNGDIYVRVARLKKGKGIVFLRDKNKDGIADDSTGFGTYSGTG